MLREPGPFPGGLPPNPACGFHRTGLSGDLCRVRDGVRVDPVVAGGADDERLAPYSRHEGGPRGLSRSWFPERLEAGDLVDCHRGAGLAELAFPFAEPGNQLLAGVGGRVGRGVTDDRPPVLPQVDPAESCYQVLLALAVLPGLVAGPRSVTGLDFGLPAPNRLVIRRPRAITGRPGTRERPSNQVYKFTIGQRWTPNNTSGC